MASSQVYVNSLIYIYNNNFHNKSITKTKRGFIEFININYNFDILIKILKGIDKNKLLDYSIKKLGKDICALIIKIYNDSKG